jgi:large subunit ribosomal protein L21e
MQKTLSMKGKLHVSKYLQQFNEGDKVVLVPYPSHQGGLFCLRFHGKTGEVIGQQGDCYKVQIKDGGKEKLCIVHPVHLVQA